MHQRSQPARLGCCVAEILTQKNIVQYFREYESPAIKFCLIIVLPTVGVVHLIQRHLKQYHPLTHTYTTTTTRQNSNHPLIKQALFQEYIEIACVVRQDRSQTTYFVGGPHGPESSPCSVTL